MRLYKRGKYWWVAWPGDERESTKCTTAQAAQAWCERERERTGPALPSLENEKASTT